MQTPNNRRNRKSATRARRVSRLNSQNVKSLRDLSRDNGLGGQRKARKADIVNILVGARVG